MKKYAWGVLLSGICLLGWGGLPALSLAQTVQPTGFLLASQGISSTATTTCPMGGGDCYFTYIGNGYTGTTTGIYTTETFTIPADVGYRADLLGFTNSGYTGSPFTDCVFTLQTPATAGDRVFVQYNANGGADCQLNPSLYYVVDTYGGTGGSYLWGVAAATKFPVTYLYLPVSGGIPAYGGWAPQFALVANGFQITPTANSTGLFLSGAQEYCNSQFGTSTAGVFGIGTDIANGFCQAAGYLFIPTPDSIQAFETILVNLGNTPPISWFGEIKDTIEASDASSTDNFINLTINFGTSTQVLGFQSLTVISTTTIRRYMSDDTRKSFRNLIAVVFYLATASFLYYEIKKLWRTT